MLQRIMNEAEQPNITNNTKIRYLQLVEEQATKLYNYCRIHFFGMALKPALKIFMEVLR